MKTPKQTPSTAAAAARYAQQSAHDARREQVQVSTRSVLPSNDLVPRTPRVGSSSLYEPLEESPPWALSGRKRRTERRCVPWFLCCVCTGLLVVLASQFSRFSLPSLVRQALARSQSPARSDTSCLDAFAALGKVKELVGLHMHQGGAPEIEREVGMEIVAGTLNQSTQLSAVLDRATLQDATRTGSVITADDLNRMAECKFGFAYGAMRLEENSHAIGGRRLVQGDIILGTVDDGLADAGFTAAQPDKGERESRLKRSLSAGYWGRGSLWQDGDVRYCFDMRATEEIRTAWRTAVASLQSQVPCLHFQEVGAGQNGSCLELPSIIVVASEAGCWSHLGRVSGSPQLPERSQPLGLGRGCEAAGSASHQLGHALGLGHEQLRPGHSQHLAVNAAALRPEAAGDLALPEEQLGAGLPGLEGEPYDLLSVMHGPPSAFARTGEVSLLPLDPALIAFVGQRMGFSNADVQKLGALYGCRFSIAPVTNGELVVALASKGEELLAPVTRAHCVCEEDWAAEGDPRCASTDNGYCCNPDEDAHGAWCVTKGRCLGRVWDYCKPRGKGSGQRVAPTTKRGCRCKADPPIECAVKETGFCCNPDGDPNGPWCHTESQCAGADYDYCTPAASD